jgi:two-component system, chemotaxis family, protein-glutamate methylesterase/glutaminase
VTAGATGKKIRVLVAEDSATMRDTLLALLGDEPDLEVAGVAVDGVEAVELARTLRPDVVTMDVVMPRLDGVGAIAAIMAEAPCRIIVVSSVVDQAQVDSSFHAVSAGALEVIAKPRSARPDDLRRWGATVAYAIRLMAEIPVVTRKPWQRSQQDNRIEIVGVVASTGGPPALARLLGALPPQLTCPVIVAQHLTDGFTTGLMRWLRQEISLAVVKAEDGMRPIGGTVYFAPDGHHIEVTTRRQLALSARGSDGECPSGDRLLTSLAAAYRDRAAGVVLTGMGDDGAEGMFAIAHAGGVTLAQDSASCVVFGMPQAAVARGGVRDLLPLDAIAQVIERLSRPSVKSR